MNISVTSYIAKNFVLDLNWVGTWRHNSSIRRHNSSINVYRERRSCLPLSLVLFTDWPEQTVDSIQFIALCLSVTQAQDAASCVTNGLNP
jgi:hypothetical protein